LSNEMRRAIGSLRERLALLDGDEMQAFQK
jgi:hypothetical protein